MVVLKTSKGGLRAIGADQHPSAEELETFRKLEESLWRPETRFDRDYMDRVLAPEFFEFGGSGAAYSRDAVLAMESSPLRARLPLPDFNARRLSLDVVQVTYVTIIEDDGAPQYRRRSSIWTNTPDGWMLRFHQGTPFAPDRGFGANGGP